jgi:hypothetical protein
VNVSLKGADRLESEGVPASTAVVVLLGTSGLDRRGVDALARFVRNGGGLVLAAGPAITPELVAAGFGDELPRLRLRAAPAAALSMMTADTRHPALAAFSQSTGAFGGARFARAAELTGTEKSAIVARFDNGDPAIVATDYGSGRTVVLASDLGNRWNDLPLQPAFVPLVGEAIAWAGGASASPASIVIGDSPLAGTDRPGTIVLPASGSHPAARVAVNVDPREFDATRMSQADFLARIARSQDAAADDMRISARREESSRGLWRYAMTLLLGVLVIESVLGRRS